MINIFINILFIIISLNLYSINISSIDIEYIRSNPHSTFYKYNKYKNYFNLGTEAENYIIFCMQCSYQIAPYGNSSFGDLHHLINCKYLNCGNYGILACMLAKAGNEVLFSECDIDFVGWDKGCFGNHQTIWINNKIFCDPTCGLYTKCSFSDVYEGKKIQILEDWHVRDDIKYFIDNVKKCIENGCCKDNYILYFLSYEEFCEKYNNKIM